MLYSLVLDVTNALQARKGRGKEEKEMQRKGRQERSREGNTSE